MSPPLPLTTLSRYRSSKDRASDGNTVRRYVMSSGMTCLSGNNPRNAVKNSKAGNSASKK